MEHLATHVLVSQSTQLKRIQELNHVQITCHT